MISKSQGLRLVSCAFIPVLVVALFSLLQFVFGVPFSKTVELQGDWWKGNVGLGAEYKIPKDLKPRPLQHPFLRVTENGVSMPINTLRRSHVVEMGGGRFRLRERTLILSATDNTDPHTNGSQYAIVLPRQVSTGWLVGIWGLVLFLGAVIARRRELRNSLVEILGPSRQPSLIFRSRERIRPAAWFALISLGTLACMTVWTVFFRVLPASRDIFANYGELSEWGWKIFAFLSMLLLSAGALWRRKAGSEGSPGDTSRFIVPEAAFLFLAVVVIFVLRLPGVFLFEANPDESQWIVGAKTLLEDPRFWISVDGTTSGPVVIYPLLLIWVIGAPINYLTVKVFAILIWIGSTLFLHGAVARHWGPQAARLATIPLVLCVATLNGLDYIAYNGEHFCFFLIAAALYFHARVVTRQGSGATALILGIILGLIPYAKLQAVPMALVITAFASIFLLVRRDRRLVPLVVGGLLPTLAIFAYLVGIDAFGTFWNSYIVNNFYHTGKNFDSHSISESISLSFRYLFGQGRDPRFFLAFWFVILAGGVIVALSKSGKLTLSKLYVVLLALLVFDAALYGVYQPRTYYEHYQLLLLVPGVFALAALFFHYSSTEHRNPWVGVAFLALTTFIPLGLSILKRDHLVMGRSRAIQQLPLGVSTSKVAEEILRYAKPGQRMGQWGWVPRYYVQTGLLQGARVPQYSRQVMEHPFQEDYIREFIEDMEANQAEVFIDADPADKSSTEPGIYEGLPHELYPAIREYIAANYRQVSEVDGVRIYRRKSASARPVIAHSDKPTF